METEQANKQKYTVKEPSGLSPRIQRLRDFYFEGVKREWNNEFSSWTTGTPWDFQFEEMSFYIVPETYAFHQTFLSSFRQIAHRIPLRPDFWSLSLPERRAWFIQEVMVNHLPKEMLPGDLLAGARFNVVTSTCHTKQESKGYFKRVMGKRGARAAMKWFHDHGYGNAGATSGHLIPDYERILKEGWRGINEDLQIRYAELSDVERNGKLGAQLRAMILASTMPRELATSYSHLCADLSQKEPDPGRGRELSQMSEMLTRIPWEPPHTFWEAVQTLWISHMLVMSEENYPGPGTSFGRIDQFLFPFWESSIQEGMDREFGKEILKCFWIHCNTAYDAMIRTGGNQGITSGYGQLITLSGIGPDGIDMTNDLTFAMLEVIDDLSPILEPKPNVRLHRNTPDALLDKIVDMIASSQGSPFLLNFDERSMAGLLLQAEKSNIQHLIHKDNVHDYAPVGCLENTMVGNDRSGTVDCNLNLLKAVELALTGGYDLIPFTDPMTGKKDSIKRWGAATPTPEALTSWETFWEAYVAQTRHIIGMIVELYEKSEVIRAKYSPTPYLSCMVRGCAEKSLDVTQGGAELSYVTIEAVTYATTVDSLLAVKYLVYDKKICTLPELVQALKDNWQGHEVLQAIAINKAPKYGQDDEVADELGFKVMEVWTEETWKHKTRSTDRQFRPGMLSWNYWVSDGFILPASPNGRPKGRFLSNALCPSNGVDVLGPTANVNSVGKVLGGRSAGEPGNRELDAQYREVRWDDYTNLLPNGGSHTITFNPSLVRDREHKEKFKAFLRGYIENGGTALQVNMIDANMLREAQKHPEDYRHLLVRITGYNAYFTSIGKELQDEIIARESHAM
jgi:pyruvate-formate lyase